MPLEDGVPRNGVFLSLRDLPASVGSWARRVRSAYEVGVEHQEERLRSDQQIRANQGVLLFDHYANQQHESLRPTRQANLPTFPDIEALCKQVVAEATRGLVQM